MFYFKKLAEHPSDPPILPLLAGWSCASRPAWTKTVPRDLLSTSFRCLVRRSAAGRAGAGRAGSIPWGTSMCPLMRWASCSLRVPWDFRTMVARWKRHVIHVIHMAPFPSPPSCCMKRGRCNSSCGSWSSSRSSFNRSSWTCCRSLTSYKLRMRSMEDLRVVAMDSINFRSRHSIGCNMDQDAPCITQTNGPWRQRSKRLATRRAASSHFRLHLRLGTCPRRSQNSFQSAKSQNSEHLWARPRGPSWVNHPEIHLGAHRDFCFPVVSLMHSLLCSMVACTDSTLAHHALAGIGHLKSSFKRTGHAPQWKKNVGLHLSTEAATVPWRALQWFLKLLKVRRRRS